MKKYLTIPFLITFLFLSSFSTPENSSFTGEVCSDEKESSLPCFLTQVNPDDGNCPASYTFFAPLGCSGYSWSLSGNAYFSSGTTSNSATVIVQRQQYVTGSFTISLMKTGSCFGESACSQSFAVTKEIYCQ